MTDRLTEAELAGATSHLKEMVRFPNTHFHYSSGSEAVVIALKFIAQARAPSVPAMERETLARTAYVAMGHEANDPWDAAVQRRYDLDMTTAHTVNQMVAFKVADAILAALPSKAPVKGESEYAQLLRILYGDDAHGKPRWTPDSAPPSMRGEMGAIAKRLLGALAVPSDNVPQDSELADVLVMTGCKDRADLEDMANVGKAFMERMAQVVETPGQFHGWSPADDPTELVTDLWNAFEEALPPSPSSQGKMP